jgi:hypothetical protein
VPVGPAASCRTDANGKALAYVYFEGGPGRARGGEAPHPDVAFAYATPS